MTPPRSERVPLRAAALGLLQGPAEVLPVSSSAHVELLAGGLALTDEQRKELAVALHAGSAAALLLGGVWPRRPALAVLAVAVPSAVGLVLERVVERRLGTPEAMAAGLAAGSVALVVADERRRRQPAAPWRRARGPGAPRHMARARGRDAADAGPTDALALGAAQACALWPGVSRSGAVLAAARARGFSRNASWVLVRETAAPVLVAATTLKGFRAVRRGADLRALAAGAAAAAISTGAALRAAPAAERVPAAVWATYRCAVAAAVLAVRDTARR